MTMCTDKESIIFDEAVALIQERQADNEQFFVSHRGGRNEAFSEVMDILSKVDRRSIPLKPDNDGK